MTVSPNAPKTLTAAILDEQGLTRDALARVLGHEGLAVTVCTGDVDELFAALNRQHADVALVEASAGADTVRELAARFPAMRTVVLSTGESADLVTECLQAGAAAYLYKRDATCQVVISAVRAVARGERLLPLDQLPVRNVPPRQNALSRLTPRERQVLGLLAAGADNLKISAALGISERTVKGYTAALYQKLEADNRVQLAIKARELGIVPTRL
ncbi:MAG: LuxR C-terminal-related transcriptional regulator [Myxococcales bacterium]